MKYSSNSSLLCFLKRLPIENYSIGPIHHHQCLSVLKGNTLKTLELVDRIKSRVKNCWCQLISCGIFMHDASFESIIYFLSSRKFFQIIELVSLNNICVISAKGIL